MCQGISLKSEEITHGLNQTETIPRPVASGGAGGALAPPVFGQSVNPISTRGADYAHHSTTSPPGFSNLATGLSLYRDEVQAVRTSEEMNETLH